MFHKQMERLNKSKEPNSTTLIQKMDCQASINRIRRDLDSTNQIIEALPEMTPLLAYEAGMYFGELSLIHKKPRMGTIVTLSSCHFAVVSAEAYEKLLKKEASLKMEQNVAFLKQIPYIRSWPDKAITSLYMYRKELKIGRGGTTIIKEGTEPSKIYIVIKGEVEVVKTGLNGVFFN